MGVSLDLCTQPRNRSIYGAGDGLMLEPPNVPQQLISVDDRTWSLSQVPQDFKLSPCQVERPTAVLGREMYEIDFGGSQAQPLDLRPTAPKDSVNAGKEFVDSAG